jgi:hypothetical protein
MAELRPLHIACCLQGQQGAFMYSLTWLSACLEPILIVWNEFGSVLWHNTEIETRSFTAQEA